MARTKKSKSEGTETTNVVRDWTWLTGDKGLINAPVGEFYDRELTDAKAKRIYKGAESIAKIADDGDLCEFVEKRMRAEAKHLVATAYYQQREVDGIKNVGKNIETLKARKAKCETLLAKLTESVKDDEEETEDKK